MEKVKDIKLQNFYVVKVNDYSSKARKEYSYLSIRYFNRNGEEKELKRVFLQDTEMQIVEYVEEI